MSRTAFNRQTFVWLAAALLLLVGVAAAPADVDSQEPAFRTIVSSEFHISRDAAELKLKVDDGGSLEVAIRDGRLWIDGRDAGAAPRGGELDRALRSFLNEGMETRTGELASFLTRWEPPADGAAIADALGRVLTRTAQAQAPEPPAAPTPPAVGELKVGPSADSLARLERLIEEMHAENEKLRERLEDRVASAERRATRRAEREASAWTRPFRYLWQGVAGIFQTLAVYAGLVGLGFATVFFGRARLERIADTARSATVQSGLVGLAGSFLLLPAFILGIIALAISIVGIPLLLIWVPLFPVAAALAAIVGYLAVAHAAGESLAERRFEGGELYRRANSYYYVLTGAGVLLALFIGANVVRMGGPWLGFLSGLLNFLAVVVTWAAFTIGFGAVLLTRAGARSAGVASKPTPDLGIDEIFEEGTRV